jgi:hypothetical protein
MAPFNVQASDSPELRSLLYFNEYAVADRTRIVYSDTDLTSYLDREIMQGALDELEGKARRIIATLENAVMWRQHRSKMRAGDRLTNQEYEDLDARLRFLEHRESWARSYFQDHLKAKGQIRQFRPSRTTKPPGPLRDFARIHAIPKNRFGNYDISWDMIEARRLVDEIGQESIGKSRDYRLALDQSEYRELVELRELQKQYWSIFDEPRPAIAILLSSGLSEHLVTRGQLVGVPSEDEHPLYRPPEHVVREMTSDKLLFAEKEYWEAAHTSKYKYQIEFYLRSGSDEVLTNYILGPDQVFSFGISDPNLGARTRKTYFAAIHKAILNQVKLRRLESRKLRHNERASYTDWIHQISKEHPEFGSNRNILHERERVTVIFTLSEDAADVIQKYQLEAPGVSLPEAR